jgi:hypothetical protein
MRIQILKQLGRNIEFSSELGTRIGDIEKQVVEGEVLDVEMDISIDLTWNVDIRLTEATEASIRYSDQKTTLIGRLESIEEDSVWIVRLGDDLLMLVVASEGKPIDRGSMLEIKTNSLVLFPYML